MIVLASAALTSFSDNSSSQVNLVLRSTIPLDTYYLPTNLVAEDFCFSTEQIFFTQLFFLIIERNRGGRGVSVSHGELDFSAVHIQCPLFVRKETPT